MQKFDLIREMKELKNQLSYAKNIGFFIGAGCSCVLGIPNIAQLTKDVEKSLEGGEKTNFDKVKNDLSESAVEGKQINIENILKFKQIEQIEFLSSQFLGKMF